MVWASWGAGALRPYNGWTAIPAQKLGRTLRKRLDSGSFQELGAARDVAAAPAKFGAVVQNDFVFAVEPGE